ncbi:hypothetical protein ACFLWA_04715 [Chloroflexota bacterium]
MNGREFGSRGRLFASRLDPWAWHVLALGLGLSALGLTTTSLGNLSQTLNGVLAVSGLLALALVWPHRPERVGAALKTSAVALMVISLPFIARGEPLGLLGAAVFFFALSLLPLEDGGPISALLLTALFFALYRILLTYAPAVWHADGWLATQVSWYLGAGLRLGPTALGLPLFFLFALYALSAFLLACFASPPSPGADQAPAIPKRNRWRAALTLLAWLLGLSLALVAYIWLQPPLGSWLVANWPAPATPSPAPALPPSLTHLDSQLLLFGLLWLVSALASLKLRPRSLPLFPPRSSALWVAAGLGLLALGAVVLTLDAPTQPRRGTILFYDAGQLEWGRPVFGQYGPHSGGDYGLWPDYLAAYGYHARIGLLTDDSLEGAQAVVLISLPEMLGAEEKERLLSFVDKGGALVIWGEHTGVGRIREPINDLLASVPMRLKFDSAVPSRLGWAQGLSLPPLPATYDVHDPVDLVVAVGASLQIDPPARPIIIGRFGHSDAGDVGNRSLNYVGDMRYNPGEPLGDLVLAAETTYGQGRIVVLGDTTPLGSVNLMTTMPFHARLLDWVTAERSQPTEFLSRNGWLAGLLLAGAGVCLALGRSRIALASAAVVLAISLALTALFNTAQSAPPVPSGPIAYVDISHQERFDRLLWEDTSIGGLAYNLVRNATLPLLLRELEADTLDGADLLVIIAPGGRFSRGEIETVAGWVEDGGRLLVSVGWEESEAAADLLAAFGLEVGHTPLGPAEVVRDEGLVRFHEAWPIGALRKDAETLVEGYGYPLAVYQPWGSGGVVLIGDSSFLLGSTLEKEDGYQEGNIMLLRDIMQDWFRIGEAP